MCPKTRVCCQHGCQKHVNELLLHALCQDRRAFNRNTNHKSLKEHTLEASTSTLSPPYLLDQIPCHLDMQKGLGSPPKSTFLAGSLLSLNLHISSSHLASSLSPP